MTEPEKVSQPGKGSHENFKTGLANSNGIVASAAMWLWSLGKEIHLNAIRVAENYEDRDQFTDSGDMIVDGLLTEVKGLSTVFNGKYWPYPDFIIDSVGAYDKKDPEPDKYLIISSDQLAYVSVDVKATKEKWTKTKKDTKTNGLDFPNDYYVLSKYEINNNPGVKRGEIRWNTKRVCARPVLCGLKCLL